MVVPKQHHALRQRRGCSDHLVNPPGLGIKIALPVQALVGAALVRAGIAQYGGLDQRLVPPQRKRLLRHCAGGINNLCDGLGTLQSRELLYLGFCG